MRFGSVCSGIEAASVAWSPLGWQAAWLSEIEPFPSAVLAHHYPDVPNLGDMTALPDRIRSGEVEAPDLFCGGTPCQAFSVAGLRKSLDDDRGNLSLTFCEIADAIDDVRRAAGQQPAIIFWENVPGVLNTKDNAFGCFLAGLAGESLPLLPAGGRWTNAGCVLGPQRAIAWRVLDAQYFGVAQRRRRVFVVASARDGFNPAKILFEFGGVRRDIAPSREAGKAVAPTVTSGAPFSRTGNQRVEAEAIVPYFSMANGQGGSEIAKNYSPTLTCVREAPIVHYRKSMAVRRLTPVECERLQGFPDNYTNIPWRKQAESPDGPRYKALGNSWAVPVVRWIGERINRFEGMQ
jgi:DNA (cytosine-5)-methyltransferase 1